MTSTHQHSDKGWAVTASAQVAACWLIILSQEHTLIRFMGLFHKKAGPLKRQFASAECHSSAWTPQVQHQRNAPARCW